MSAPFLFLRRIQLIALYHADILHVFDGSAYLGGGAKHTVAITTTAWGHHCLGILRTDIIMVTNCRILYFQLTRWQLRFYRRSIWYSSLIGFSASVFYVTNSTDTHRIWFNITQCIHSLIGFIKLYPKRTNSMYLLLKSAKIIQT